jgi:hypothetical protein
MSFRKEDRCVVEIKKLIKAKKAIQREKWMLEGSLYNIGIGFQFVHV